MSRCLVVEKSGGRCGSRGGVAVSDLDVVVRRGLVVVMVMMMMYFSRHTYSTPHQGICHGGVRNKAGYIIGYLLVGGAAHTTPQGKEGRG